MKYINEGQHESYAEPFSNACKVARLALVLADSFDLKRGFIIIKVSCYLEGWYVHILRCLKGTWESESSHLGDFVEVDTPLKACLPTLKGYMAVLKND